MEAICGAEGRKGIGSEEGKWKGGKKFWRDNKGGRGKGKLYIGSKEKARGHEMMVIEGNVGGGR